MIGWIILIVLMAPLVAILVGMILFLWLAALIIVLLPIYRLLGKEPPDWFEVFLL